MLEADGALARVASWLREARSVVALTGAGISTESGIPDFRGPNGVWTRDPKAEKLSDIRHYMSDPEVRTLAWQSRLRHPAFTAEPNHGHLALAALERQGRLHTLVTQNIDGLHQKAGSSPGVVVEIHGTIHEVVCMACGDRAPMHLALEHVRAGEVDPPCLQVDTRHPGLTCGGVLKSATVSFGQSLDAADLARAQRAAGGCDVFLAVGTSLTVFPVAQLPGVALAYGARLVIVNAQPTSYDHAADAVFHAPAGDLLPRLAELV